MMRLRLTELIEQVNEQNPEERLHMQIVAESIGVHRTTLAGLTKFEREPVTNSAIIECLARFFKQRLADFELADLFAFLPDLNTRSTVRIDQLYPRRAQKAEAYRQRNSGE